MQVNFKTSKKQEGVFSMYEKTKKDGEIPCQKRKYKRKKEERRSVIKNSFSRLQHYCRKSGVLD